MMLFILRGLPGSGKSTEARIYARNMDAIICSADDYFMVDGEYKFDPSKLPEAHAACLQKVIDAMKDRVAIVVDNTNSQFWEFKKYVEAAKKYGYKVNIHIVGEISMGAAERYAKRTVHGVPLSSIKKMVERWEN